MSIEKSEEYSLIHNLEDAGLDEDEINEYLKFEKENLNNQKICLLSKHRRCLLEYIHGIQKQLDCLDYLLYKIRKQND